MRSTSALYKNVVRNKKFQESLMLSFSGAGHLLAYHLGVAEAFLLRSKNIPPVIAACGSSSGAIVAVVYCHLGHRIHEYAERFLSDSGNAYKHLKDMLHEEEAQLTSNFGNTNPTQQPILHIATTKCIDGSTKLWSFDRSNQTLYKTISSHWNIDPMLKAVKASCKIPISFHPFDCLDMNGMKNSSYPSEEGIRMEDGLFHVDGGIAAPAPLAVTPGDNNSSSIPIIVSPVSYSSTSQNSQLKRISPPDTSWRLIPIQNIQCKAGFQVRPSIQNLKTLRVAGGITNSSELETWYGLGKENAEQQLQKWFDK